MNLSAKQIQFFHAIIFLLLMASLGYAIYSVAINNITSLTWGALGLILVEGIILAYFEWQCPLTTWAENRGAENGAVADLFMPKFLADRLFPIYGFVYVVTLALVVYRTLNK